jgi:antitoxin VapB
MILAIPMIGGCWNEEHDEQVGAIVVPPTLAGDAEARSTEIVRALSSFGTPQHMSLAYARRWPMPGPRHVRLFRNGRNQAVRIPVEFELPGDEAIMHRDDDRLVIEPVRKRGLVALLKTMKPLEEGFPAIDDPVPAPENVL